MIITLIKRNRPAPLWVWPPSRSALDGRFDMTVCLESLPKRRCPHSALGERPFWIPTSQSTPFDTVFLQKPTFPQLVEKSPTIYENRKFVSVHKDPPPVSILRKINLVHTLLLKIHFNIIPSTPRSYYRFFPLRPSNQNFKANFHTFYKPRPLHSPVHINNSYFDDK